MEDSNETDAPGIKPYIVRWVHDPETMGDTFLGAMWPITVYSAESQHVVLEALVMALDAGDALSIVRNSYFEIPRRFDVRATIQCDLNSLPSWYNPKRHVQFPPPPPPTYKRSGAMVNAARPPDQAPRDFIREAVIKVLDDKDILQKLISTIEHNESAGPVTHRLRIEVEVMP